MSTIVLARLRLSCSPWGRCLPSHKWQGATGEARREAQTSISKTRPWARRSTSSRSGQGVDPADMDHKVTLHLENATLPQVLDATFLPIGLRYEINGERVTVGRR